MSGEELTPAGEAEFQGMAEAVESFFVATFVRFSNFRAVSEGPQADEAIKDYVYALYAHKGLRRVWRTQSAYWGARNQVYGQESNERFRERVESLLTELDERSAPTPSELRYVFW